MPDEKDPAESLARLIAAVAHNTEILRARLQLLTERVDKLERAEKLRIQVATELPKEGT